MSQEKIEKNVGLLIVCTLLAVLWGGLVEILPLFFQESTTTATLKDEAGNQLDVKPYDAVALAGREVFIREGCYNCHSQMIRPFRAETERYGHYSVAAESRYDHPFQWGSKRTGPDLARVGGRYSTEWHRTHLRNPRDVVVESNMPAYSWLKDARAKDTVGRNIDAKLAALTLVGVPYTKEDIDGAKAAIGDLTEEDVLIEYLQGLGTLLSNFR
ncbi:cbb3-type cytochrome c oxidase subunit II [Betaproteobacteria bacterium]|nr:cbb3-type cytochrome c oxidase subunit II [Betaproteobacteria bacterium]GHU45427.1 cbb3-type cytochrome c oxidase subunit II [Betaproteobacteria bacterium]